MADIFISYASEDRERIIPIVKVLEEHGWSIFWDWESIPVGKTWREVIDEGLEAAGCILVLWSQISTTKKKRWVLEEADYGLEHGKLVPALIDDVRPPRGFGQIQAAKLINWDGDKTSGEYKKLVNALESIIGPSPMHVRESGRALEAERLRNQKEERRKAEERRRLEEEQRRIDAERKAEEERKRKQREEELAKKRKLIAYTALVFIVIACTSYIAFRNKQPSQDPINPTPPKPSTNVSVKGMPPEPPISPSHSGSVQTGIQSFYGVWKNSNESLGLLSQININVIDQKVFVRAYQKKVNSLQPLEEVPARVDKTDGCYELKMTLSIDSIVHNYHILSKEDNVLTVRDYWSVANQPARRAEYLFKRIPSAGILPPLSATGKRFP